MRSSSLDRPTDNQADTHPHEPRATTETPVDPQTVDEILAEWPDEPADVAAEMRETYGDPDEAAPSELCWYDNGPWKRTELYRDGVPHNFPKEHTDYLKQSIDYHVPPEKADDLAKFDGSVYVDRTNGELAAKCAHEPANFLAINLAHDIVTDQKTVDAAREAYARAIVKQDIGEPPEITRRLQFDPAEDKQRDPDEAIITEELRDEVEASMQD